MSKCIAFENVINSHATHHLVTEEEWRSASGVWVYPNSPYLNAPSYTRWCAMEIENKAKSAHPQSPFWRFVERNIISRPACRDIAMILTACWLVDIQRISNPTFTFKNCIFERLMAAEQNHVMEPFTERLARIIIAAEAAYESLQIKLTYTTIFPEATAFDIKAFLVYAYQRCYEVTYSRFAPGFDEFVHSSLEGIDVAMNGIYEAVRFSIPSITQRTPLPKKLLGVYLLHVDLTMGGTSFYLWFLDLLAARTHVSIIDVRSTPSTISRLWAASTMSSCGIEICNHEVCHNIALRVIIPFMDADTNIRLGELFEVLGEAIVHHNKLALLRRVFTLLSETSEEGVTITKLQCLNMLKSIVFVLLKHTQGTLVILERFLSLMCIRCMLDDILVQVVRDIPVTPVHLSRWCLMHDCDKSTLHQLMEQTSAIFNCFTRFCQKQEIV